MRIGGGAFAAGEDSDDSIHDSSFEATFPPSSGTVKGDSPPPSPSSPKKRRTSASTHALLPPPSQGGRAPSSSRVKRSGRGDDGFSSASFPAPALAQTLLPPPSQAKRSSRSSATTSTTSTSTSRRSSRSSTSHSLPIGVPRPPTARRSIASKPQTKALRETQPQSQESSQEDVLPEPSLRKEREREREREREERRRKEKGKEKALEVQVGTSSRRDRDTGRSTTPTFSPPPLSPSTSTNISSFSAFLLPPPQLTASVPTVKTTRRTSSRSSASKPTTQIRTRGTTPTFSPPPHDLLSLPSLRPPPPPAAPTPTTAKTEKEEERRLRPVPVMFPSSFRPRLSSPNSPPRQNVELEVLIIENEDEEPPPVQQEKKGEEREPREEEGKKQRVVIGSDWREWRIKKRSRALYEAEEDEEDEQEVELPRRPPSASSPPQPSTTRERPHSPSRSTLPLPALRSLEPKLCDPLSLYRLSSSLLFRLEYLKPSSLGGGPPTWAQGAKVRGYGAKGLSRLRAGGEARGKEKEKEREKVVPSWAKTEEGEWDESLLSLLSRRISAAPTFSTGWEGGRGKKVKEVEDFTALIWARDLARLRRVQLGEGGGVECYLVSPGQAGEAEGEGQGKGQGEFPCKSVVVVGWVGCREWKDREGGWEYVVDDGTGLVEIFCPSSTPPDSHTFLRPSSALNPPSLLPSLTHSTSTSTSPARLSPRRSIAARHALLESRAEEQSDKTVVKVGSLVRVVGRVEEPAWAREGAREGEGRRVRAVRMDVIPPHLSLPTESAHHRLLTALHRDLYSQPSFDLRAALDRIEQREEQERAERSMMSDASSVASSSYAAGSTAGSSVGGSSPGRIRYRPTRPSKLAPEDLTLTNFVLYVRFHLQDKYIKTISPSASSTSFADLLASPSPSASSSAGVAAPFDPFAPTPSPPTAPFSEATEISLPFSLPTLQSSSSNLQLFARRLAQERARLKIKKEEGERARKKRLGLSGGVLLGPVDGGGGRRAGGGAYIAPGVTGVGRAARGTVKHGSGAFLLPPPSSSSRSSRAQVQGGESSETRRARLKAERADSRGEDGPLKGEELEKEVGKVWRDALRTMRGNGVVVEYVAPPALPEEEAEEGMWGREGQGEGLPDEPSWAGKRRKEEQVEAEENACPWGDPFANLDLDGDGSEAKTPRAARTRTSKVEEEEEEAASGCPWGDVKLEWDSPSPKRGSSKKAQSRGGEDDVVFKTPTAKRISPNPRRPTHSSNSKTPRPAAATASSSPLALPSSAQSSSAARVDVDASLRSDSSYMTTGSLDYSLSTSPTSPSLPHFQLVTSRALAPLVLSLLTALYAAGKGSVTTLEIRKRMASDDRWAKVAEYSTEVDGALGVLEERGEAERYGKGWRPARTGGGRC